MTPLLLMANAALIGLALVLACRTGSPRVRGTIVHPVGLVAALMAIVMIDFLDASARLARNEVLRLGSYNLSDAELMAGALVIATAYHLMMLLGMLAALLSFRGQRAGVGMLPAAQDIAGKLAGRILFLIALGLALIGAMLTLKAGMSSGFGMFFVSATRQTFFKDNPIVYALTIFLIPSLAVFLVHERLLSPLVLGSTALAALVLLVAGSRNHILFVALLLLVLFVRDHRRLSLAWLLVALPVAAWLLVLLQFIQRGWYSYSSTEEMTGASGGMFSYLFNTPEVSFAEALSIVHERADLALAPFSSLLAVLLRPVPRSLIELKPDPPSTHFTQVIDPWRMANYGSELTMTGFGNLYAELGLIGGAVMLLLLAAWWARATFRHAARFPSGLSPLWLAYLTWWGLMFLRTDLYIVSFSMWPLAFVLLAYGVLRYLIRRLLLPVPLPPPAVAM